jgi:hypothetical protein
MKTTEQGFMVWDDETCGHCGYVETDPEEHAYYLVCPDCGREGCDDCMPMGRGCPCPECEDGEAEDAW